jgi:hypothetical protein
MNAMCGDSAQRNEALKIIYSLRIVQLGDTINTFLK